MLRGTHLAEEACRDRWAPSLIEFVTENGRMPDSHEVRPLVALSRKNDIDARDYDGPMGHVIRQFRETMHEAAASRLGFRRLTPDAKAA